MFNVEISLEPEIPNLMSDIEGVVTNLISELTTDIAKGAKGLIVKRSAPSKPGQSPTYQSGHLAGLIKPKATGLEGVVDFEAAYSGILEFKRDRPFIEPAIELALVQTLPNL